MKCLWPWRTCALTLLCLLLVACNASRQPTPPPATPPPQPAGTAQPSPSAAGRPTSAASPDLILRNGTIITMQEAQPRAQAIAIAGERILAVGEDAQILSLQGPATRVIDLQGRTVMPGFIDGHAHRIWYRHNWNYASSEEAIRDALSQGWTGLEELAVTPDEMNELRDLDGRGELRLRVNAYLLVNSFEGQPLGDWFRAYRPGQQLSPYLRVAGLKIFIDFDSGRTLYWQQDELNELVRGLQSEGWTVSMKAISIQSHELALNAYEYALDGEPNDLHRHRIEHSIAVTDEQLARMARLGIITGIQPSLPGTTAFDPDTYRMRDEAGPHNAWRWRDYYEAGIKVVASPLNPYPGIQEHTLPTHMSPMAVLYRGATKVGVGGRKPEPWMLEQALTVEQMLPMLTINGAYATVEEDKKGSLAPGKWADLVILSGDPLATPTEELLSIRTLVTMVGGRVEWCAADAQALCPTSTPMAPVTVEPVLVVPAGQPIRIAVVGPASGAHAAFVPAMLEAAQMAVDEHGPVHGVGIVLEPFDDACDEEAGAEAARAIADRGEFAAVLGPLCSTATRGGLRFYGSKTLPVVSPGATDPTLPPLGPAVFNRVTLNRDQLSALGREETYVDALPDVQAFYAAYQARTGDGPPEAYRHSLALGYDAMGILLDALARAAEPQADGSLRIRRLQLAQEIRATSGYRGVTGEITFDVEGNRLP